MSATPATWTVLSMLEWTTDYFTKKGVKSPRLSIEWLLAFVLQKKRLDLYLCFDRPLTSEELEKLRPLVKRRSLQEPLQYIVGETDFFNVVINVNEHVLIPRQETEQLVQRILNAHPRSEPLKVLDVGTGSGCIPISLKTENSEWDITATDISKEALELATANAARNNTAITFIHQDLFNPHFENANSQFDVIISNPPYILREEEQGLDEEVKNYEPHLALFCESTDHIFSALENYCSKFLAENGKAYFEIHEHEAAQTAQVFSAKGWDVKILSDYDLKERFLVISR